MIEYKELEDVVNRTKIEYGQEVSYKGVGYLIFPCLSTESGKLEIVSPAFYRPSSLTDWDIYLEEDEEVLPEKFRKPVLLHEILEAEQIGKLMRSGIENELAKRIAHNIAKKYDDFYAKRNMDAKTYLEYCEFRDKWEKNTKESKLEEAVI